jgi:regulator of cell morphogenesis and NO signaling
MNSRGAVRAEQEGPILWDGSLCSLIDEIEARHHSLLRNEVPRLQDLVARALATEGRRYSGVFRALQEELARLWFEIEKHMEREEDVLFPYVRQMEDHARAGAARPAGDPARLVGLTHEHEDAGDRIARISRLTGGYVMPEGAGAVLRELYAGLRALEDDLTVHIQLEDEVLIPRAMAMAQSLTEGGPL